MVTSDLEYKVTSWSLTAEGTFGHTAEEAIGNSMVDLICAREFSQACFAIFLEVKNARLEWEGEMLARAEVGGALPVEGEDLADRGLDGRSRRSGRDGA